MHPIYKTATNRKLVCPIILCMIILSIASTLYIIDNIFVLLEQATVQSFKPVKNKHAQKKVIRDISYASDQHTLDIYSFKKCGVPRKVLIVFPGGMWQGYHKKNYYHITRIGQEHNYVTVIVQVPTFYGYVSRHIVSTSDLENRNFVSQSKSTTQAIKWVYNHISHYCGDPKNITLLSILDAVYTIGYANQQDPDIYSNVKKMIWLDPILDLSIVSNKFYEQQLKPIFWKNESIAKNYQVQPNKIPTLIMYAERGYPFTKKAIQQIKQKQKHIIIHEMLGITTKELLFRLGRKTLVSTQTLSYFLTQSF